MSALPAGIASYFAAKGWEPFAFQKETWAAQAAGESGLIHAPTGMGKTLAAWLHAPAYAAEQPKDDVRGLKVLWLTPMRALAHDTAHSLQEPLEHLGSTWLVEARTGDTSSSMKSRQEKKPPDALVTTPESLCLLLTRKSAPALLGKLGLVILDEWHELLGSKRGVLTELALARLRAFSPRLITWGLSATLGNVDEALEHLTGYHKDGRRRSGRLVRGVIPKEIVIDSLLPEPGMRLPWAGHLGLSMLPQVLKELEQAATALVFTNTRAQAELWHRGIVEARPDWAGEVALHHGSLDQGERLRVEKGLKDGSLRVVVCTSSLDLGVDFSPVDRVLQIGSPKGIARLLQRAGRSGHGPGRASRVTCVPAAAMHLVESAAARDAAEAGRIEARPALGLSLDVLVQHVVTVALGQGFTEDELFEEVRCTAAFKDLRREDWRWVLDFTALGGAALTAYPEYHKLDEKSGRYSVDNATTARRHRMNVGTILSDASITVRYMKGKVLGTVEESFLAKLSPGDPFVFAGRPLILAKIDNMTAYVRRGRRMEGAVPVWYGGRMPLSTRLCEAVRRQLDQAARGVFDSPEMQRLRELFALQKLWSHIPRKNEFLIESFGTKEGRHLCLYPFEGRLVHEGMAALIAMRLARLKPSTFTWSVNDYGFELLSKSPVDLDAALASNLFSSSDLAEDIAAGVNHTELAKSQFREVSRVAGLVFTGYPGKGKSSRQIQATAGLLYDVFTKYDPENLLLHQARREVFERQLESDRLGRALAALKSAELVVKELKRPSPLAFPLMVDRMRATLSSETFGERVQRLILGLESAQENSLENAQEKSTANAQENNTETDDNA
jgi:ATP-dependent Lhr-like helicase